MMMKNEDDTTEPQNPTEETQKPLPMVSYVFLWPFCASVVLKSGFR